MIAASVLTATSCSDFSDYNEVKSDAVATGNRPLWDNIVSDPQLSDFAALVKKAGFDKNLQASHFYTIWAPINGTFDAAYWNAKDSASLLTEFIQSHVAEYNYTVSGPRPHYEEVVDNKVNRVNMLNGKSFLFEGETSYTFGDVPVAQINIPCENGVMHTLRGAAAYRPDVYEYLTTPSYVQAAGVDSVAKFFTDHHIVVRDEANSVKGPMVDGKQTYILEATKVKNDVVTTLVSNTISGRADQYSLIERTVSNEDSLYTIVLPNNDAWNKIFPKVKAQFKYLTNTKVETQLLNKDTYTASSATVNTTDTDLRADSLARWAIVQGLLFSHTDAYRHTKDYNEYLLTGNDSQYKDSLYYTLHGKYSDGKQILTATNHVDTLSNGFARVVDSLDFHPWERYSPELWYGPFGDNVAYRKNATSKTITYSEFDLKQRGIPGDFSESGGLRYLQMIPSSDYAKPELSIYLPDVRSTTYDFYCVMVNPAADDTTATEKKPNQLNFTLTYADKENSFTDWRFSSDLKNNNPRTPVVFETDTTQMVDTLYLGRFTFPYSYTNLDGYGPNIKIVTPFSVFNRTLMAKYTRALRVAAIILKPIELVEFESTK